MCNENKFGRLRRAILVRGKSSVGLDLARMGDGRPRAEWRRRRPWGGAVLHSCQLFKKSRFLL